LLITSCLRAVFADFACFFSQVYTTLNVSYFTRPLVRFGGIDSGVPS